MRTELNDVKELRKSKGMSGEAVAEAAGITQQYYSCIELGTRRPSVDVAKRIATVLGIDWTRFYEDKGETT